MIKLKQVGQTLEDLKNQELEMAKGGKGGIEIMQPVAGCGVCVCDCTVNSDLFSGAYSPAHDVWEDNFS